MAKKKVITKKTMSSNFDPLGSYTGITPDGERPIQDADDL